MFEMSLFVGDKFIFENQESVNFFKFFILLFYFLIGVRNYKTIGQEHSLNVLR